MDPTVAALALRDRGISYAITGRDLKVIEVEDPTGLAGQGGASVAGHPLTELVPELIGAEDVLADILAGRLPRFQLSLVNRDRADGQTIYLNLIVLPHRDQAGRITGVVHLWEDITELASFEQRLLQQRNELRLLQEQSKRQNLVLAAANAELQRLDELTTMFVSAAAHELRTPLTSILGYLEMVLDGDFGPLTGGQRESLETAQESARRLNAITSDLLDLTRIQAGRIELLLRPVDLAHVLRGVARELAPQFTARQQRLALEAHAGLPLALCDEARAAQIIGNLLSNANKYTPKGGSIAVNLAPADEAGFLRLAVADTGVGIAPEDQAKVFERFFRAGSATTAQAGGAGLGLPIARSLVELHGGRIWFESQSGQGSTFYVTFPIAA